MELVVDNNMVNKINWAKLEHTLIAHFRPTFLFISVPDIRGNVDVIISCIKFQYLTIQQRVMEVFNLINNKCPEILQKHLLIIQCYDTNEMESLLMDVFK